MIGKNSIKSSIYLSNLYHKHYLIFARYRYFNLFLTLLLYYRHVATSLKEKGDEKNNADSLFQASGGKPHKFDTVMRRLKPKIHNTHSEHNLRQ